MSIQQNVIGWIREELSLNEDSVRATVSMLGQGDTVPFI